VAREPGPKAAAAGADDDDDDDGPFLATEADPEPAAAVFPAPPAVWSRWPVVLLLAAEAPDFVSLVNEDVAGRVPGGGWPECACEDPRLLCCCS